MPDAIPGRAGGATVMMYCQRWSHVECFQEGPASAYARFRIHAKAHLLGSMRVYDR